MMRDLCRVVPLVFGAIIFLWSGPGLLRADPKQVVEIERADSPPVIDGEVGEWDQVRWLPFAPGAPDMSHGPINRLLDDGPTEPAGTARTAADLSGSFALQWDDEWIYLAARVIDNVHDVTGKTPQQWWFRDTVALFLDIPLDRDGMAFLPGDHAFAFAADPTYPDYGKWWRYGDEAGWQDASAPPETRLAVQLTQDGYRLEAAIPMAVLTRLTPDWHPPFEGREVGFMFLVADPDNGPEPYGGQLIYGGDYDHDGFWSRLKFAPARVVSPENLGTVTGKVAYQHDGSPWAGGTVRVVDPEGRLQEEATTDAEGRYQVRVVPGVYNLAAGSQLVEVEVDRAGEVQKIDMVVPPTRARLCFWVGPERMDAFAARYEERLAPLLRQHGLVPATESGRTTVDSVFSRLFVVPTPSALVWKRTALQTDPAWPAGLRELEDILEFTRPDSLVQGDLRLYQAPAGSGQARRSGPGAVWEQEGRSVKAGTGFRQGAWLNLGVPEGLPQSTVRSMLQDREGHLWFGMDGQVCRYDGQTWTTFFVAEDSLSYQVTAMVEDGAGHLWFGTWGGGVSRYDGEHWTHFSAGDGLAQHGAGVILADREGRLWFGTTGGVTRYDGQEWTTFTVEDGLAHGMVSAVLEDREGHLWFGTWGGGVSRYDGEQWTTFAVEDGLAHNVVSAIAEDSAGNLWFGTWGGGVSRYDGQEWTTFTVEDGLADNVVTAIAEDRAGNLWFGTDGGGVSRYDGECLANSSAEDGLAGDAVQCILADREGLLWFGTWGGVSQYSGEQIRTFTTTDGLAADKVWSILEDRDGHLWCGTDGGGVSRYDGQGWTTFTVADGLAHNVVNFGAMAEDREGHLWFGTQGGVSRYDGQSWTTFTKEDGLAHNSVTAVGEDRVGNLWFGTQGTFIDVALSRYDGEQWTTFTVEDGLPYGPVRSILEDREGSLWFGVYSFGTLGGGVRRYDGQEFVPLRVDGLADNRVRSMSADQEGRIWFGTPGGASRYDGERFENFTVEDGLSHNSVSSILEDQEGHLWFGTLGGGVSRYDGFLFQHLRRQDGLPSNTVFDLHQTANGEVWIATAKGLTRYRPQPTPPPIHLTRVVADCPYRPAEEIRLPSSQELLVFEFQGISFKTHPDQMLYLYQLEGYDDEWHQTRETRVEYTDLPVGDYVFQVKAVDRDLNYSEAPAQVQVQVHLPYAQLGWIAALVLALVLGAWQTGRVVRRDRRLHESNQQLQEQSAALERANREVLQASQAKSAFLANMSHELRTPMNAIINFSSLILEDVYGEIPEDLRDAVEEIDHNGDILLTLINDILDLSKIEAGSLQLQVGPCVPEVCIENAVAALEYRATDKGLRLVREVEEELPLLQADERRLTQHILVNLVKNAIKFTQEGEVRVGARSQDGSVLFWVSDTGIGIPPAEQEQIFEVFHQVDGSITRSAEGTGLGLAICRRFVEMHGGRIWVESAPGEGATFFFTIPTPAKSEEV